MLQVAYETTVDLQLIGWQAFEIEQARIAGTKIVDGDIHAHLDQPLENLLTGAHIVHGGAFSDFQGQAIGRQLVA